MIKIAMIRHGKTYGNTLGRYIGVTDEPLCEEGKKELEQRTMDTVELLFVSPLKRCLETAGNLYPILIFRIPHRNNHIFLLRQLKS